MATETTDAFAAGGLFDGNHALPPRLSVSLANDLGIPQKAIIYCRRTEGWRAGLICISPPPPHFWLGAVVPTRFFTYCSDRRRPAPYEIRRFRVRWNRGTNVESSDLFYVLCRRARPSFSGARESRYCRRSSNRSRSTGKYLPLFSARFRPDVTAIPFGSVALARNWALDSVSCTYLHLLYTDRNEMIFIFQILLIYSDGQSRNYQILRRDQMQWVVKNTNIFFF